MCCAHTRTHIHTHMQTQTLCALQSETLHVCSLHELISCNSPPARVLVGHRPTTWIPVKRTVWAKGESIWEGSRLSSYFKKTETTAAKKSISYPGFLVFQTRIIFWKKSSEHKLYGGCFSSRESRARVCVCFLLSLSTLCTTRVLRHISDQSTAITPRPFRMFFSVSPSKWKCCPTTPKHSDSYQFWGLANTSLGQHILLKKITSLRRCHIVWNENSYLTEGWNNRNPENLD